jgi:hypothetical protein
VHIYSGKKAQQREERIKKKQTDKQNKAKQQHNTGLRKETNKKNNI